MKKRRWIAALAGALLLAFVVGRVGISSLVDQLDQLVVVLPVVLAASILRLMVQTSAWRIALGAEGIEVSRWRLLAIRLASQTAGYAAVLGPAVAEPAKLILLRDTAPLRKSAPATLLESGAYWICSAILGLAGTVAAAIVFSRSSDAAGLLLAAAATFVFAGALLLSKKSVIPAIAQRLGKRAPAWLILGGHIEEEIRSFRFRYSSAARKVFLLDAFAQTLTLVEVAAVLWAAAIPVGWAQVLVIEATARFVKVVASWLPGRLGADESGASGVFLLLGLPPATGLLLALARRGRDLVFALAGVLWLNSGAFAPPAAKEELCPERR